MNAPDSALTKTIIAAIGKHQNIRLAILFGSLAVGRGRAKSDLDLAVDVGRPLLGDEKIALINELAIETGRPIDLVDIRAVGEPLLGQIIRHGKRILGSDTAYGELMSRHLFDRIDFLPYRDRILAARRQARIGK